MASATSQARPRLHPGQAEDRADPRHHRPEGGPPATEGSNPLQGPIATPDYLDIVENDAQRGHPTSKEEAIGRMDALHGQFISRRERACWHLPVSRARCLPWTCRWPILH
eukprot:2583267-Pyramimonas_sp.AAC.1